MATNPFVDDDYDVPESPGNYMRLEQGDNRIRVMSRPILGWEWWTEDEDGKHPNRVHKQEEVPKGAKDIRHFWAMLVWNYQLDTLQVLEITQKTIQKEILRLSRDKDWGSPVGDGGYDIVINRKGEQLNTEYSILPKPAKKLDEAIVEAMDGFYCNLDALYEGEDPFENPNDEEVPF